MKRVLCIATLIMFVFTLPAFGAAKSAKIPVSGGGRTYYNIYDEDTMSSDSATGLPTQQSVKAYVDTTVAAVTATRYVQIPLNSFKIEVGGVGSTVGSSTTAISGSTAPGFEIDDKMVNIVWADGETTPITRTFRIPPDYQSGGTFRAFTTESDSTTPNQLDFDVYVNTSGTVADAAATNQTPVAVAGDTATPMEDILTVATDFASLAAGDRVTIRLWRDNVAAGTGDLELKEFGFVYTASE